MATVGPPPEVTLTETAQPDISALLELARELSLGAGQILRDGLADAGLAQRWPDDATTGL